MFEQVELAPPIEVFQLNAKFLADENLDKVNLGVGGKIKPFNFKLIWLIDYETAKLKNKRY